MKNKNLYIKKAFLIFIIILGILGIIYKSGELLILILISIGLFSFFGGFTKVITTYAYIIGRLLIPINQKSANDYSLWVEYSSKGAFVANQSIHVKAILTSSTPINSLKNSKFRVNFPGAYPTKHIKEIQKRKFRFIDESILFENITDGQNVKETDITYMSPGKHIFNIMINKIQQIKQSDDDASFYLAGDGHESNFRNINPNHYLVPKKAYIYVGPSENRLQINISNYMLGLTFFIIALMLLQILI